MNLCVKLVLICVLVSACNLTTNTPTFDKPKLDISLDSGIELHDVKFTVLTEENSKIYFQNHKATFSLTEQDYKNLSLNVEELRQFIVKQLKIIKLYKDYYESSSDSKVSK
jgi:hypothetical protein